MSFWTAVVADGASIDAITRRPWAAASMASCATSPPASDSMHQDVRLLAERCQGRGGRPRGIGAHLTLAHQRFTVDMEDADLWLERDDVVGALLVQQVDECRHDG